MFSQYFTWQGSHRSSGWFDIWHKIDFTSPNKKSLEAGISVHPVLKSRVVSKEGRCVSKKLFEANRSQSVTKPPFSLAVLWQKGWSHSQEQGIQVNWPAKRSIEQWDVPEKASSVQLWELPGMVQQSGPLGVVLLPNHYLPINGGVHQWTSRQRNMAFYGNCIVMSLKQRDHPLPRGHLMLIWYTRRNQEVLGSWEEIVMHCFQPSVDFWSESRGTDLSWRNMRMASFSMLTASEK